MTVQGNSSRYTLPAYAFHCRIHNIQVAQLWQRNCTSSIDCFKGWVNLRLTFRLKGYVLRHYAYLLNVYVSDRTFPAIKHRIYGIIRPVHEQYTTDSDIPNNPFISPNH